MNTKKSNRYKILLQELELKDGTQSGKSIEFEFTNHDDIFSILEATKDSFGFENKTDNQEFVVGLKLFSEVMLRNKKHLLFKEFFPHFVQFMSELKRSVK